MSMTISDVLHDAGKVAADGTRLAGCQNGTPARSAAGIYTYTLRPGASIDAAQSVCFVQANTANLEGDIVQSSDVLFTVTFNTDAGVDTDSIWGFILLKLHT
jgi:hypothetical protein